MTADVTMREMFESGVHFGHQCRYWHPKMGPYIYGKRHNMHIIDLEQSLPMFRRALKIVEAVAKKKGKVLFVGTKYGARNVVREEAVRCGMFYVDQRWLGGMLTNYKTIRQSIKRLKDLEELLGNPTHLAGMTKKEILNLTRKKDKLYANFSGIKTMGGLPDLLFVIDVGMESVAIEEAHRLGIPVIGIADTNTDPTGIDYLIPGNDDAVRAIRFYCKSVAETIIAARGEIELAQVKAKSESEEAAETPAQPKKRIVTKKKVAIPAAEEARAVTQSENAADDDVEIDAKKATAKKTVAKKVTVEKTAAKKVTSKQADTKKVATKKADTKKAATKKADIKKAATKKADTKKSATKKAATKKSDKEPPADKQAVAEKEEVSKQPSKEKAEKNCEK